MHVMVFGDTTKMKSRETERGIKEHLKGHSQLFYRADLDTSFPIFEKSPPEPEIKVTRREPFEICFNPRSVLLNF